MAVAPLIPLIAGAGKSAATAAVTGAAIAGGTQLAGAALGSRANSRATQAQERARQEAMAYERKKEQEALSERRRQWDDYVKAYNTWYAKFGDDGVRQYGVAPGIEYPKAAMGGGEVSGGAAPTSPRVRPPQTPGHGTLGAMMTGATAEGVAPTTAPGTAPAGLVAPAGPAAGAMAAPTQLFRPPAPTGPQGPRPGTLGNLADWEDWSHYGVGR